MKSRDDYLRAIVKAIRARKRMPSMEDFDTAELILQTGLTVPTRPDQMSVSEVASRQVIRALTSGKGLDEAVGYAVNDSRAWVLADPESTFTELHIAVKAKWGDNPSALARKLLSLGNSTKHLIFQLGDFGLEAGTLQGRELATLVVDAYLRAAEAAGEEQALGANTPNRTLTAFARRLVRELVDVNGRAAPDVMRDFGQHLARGLTEGPAQVLADAWREVLTVDILPADVSPRAPRQESRPTESVAELSETVFRPPLTWVVMDRTTLPWHGLDDYLFSARAFDGLLKELAATRETVNRDAGAAMQRVTQIAGSLFPQRRRPHSKAQAEMLLAGPPTVVRAPGTLPDPFNVAPGADSWAMAWAKSMAVDAGASGRVDLGPDYLAGLVNFEHLLHVRDLIQTWRSGLGDANVPHLEASHRRLDAALDGFPLVDDGHYPTRETARAFIDAVQAVENDKTYVDNVQNTAEHLARHRAAEGEVLPGRAAALWKQVELETAAALVPWERGAAEPDPARQVHDWAASDQRWRVARADAYVRVQHLIATAPSTDGSQAQWPTFAELVTSLVLKRRTNPHAEAGIYGVVQVSAEDLGAAHQGGDGHQERRERRDLRRDFEPTRPRPQMIERRPDFGLGSPA